jgi:hypothetical protein
MTTQGQPPQAVLLEMLTGYWKAQSISVAARLKIADLVQEGPKSADELAKATGTHAQSLYRLLRALASIGIFAEDAGQRFGLTPLATCLLDKPGSQRAVALMVGDEHYRAWGDLLYSIQTGKTAFEHIYHQPIFDYLAERPEQAKIFDAAMVGVHGAETQAMVDAYDFSPFRKLVDVGGGNGSVLRAVLGKYPKLQGVLYDRPDVIERARADLRSAGLEQRCAAVGGSFFESVPAGGDAYFMRHIIHDWYEEQCLTILRHIRKVIPKEGKLLLVESVIPPGNAPSFAKFLDLNMLVIPGGMERTESQYRQLFAEAGFRLARIVPTRLEPSVIEGEPM